MSVNSWERLQWASRDLEIRGSSTPTAASQLTFSDFSFLLRWPAMMKTFFKGTSFKMVGIKTSFDAIFFKQLNCIWQNHWSGARSVGEVFQVQNEDSRQAEGQPAEHREGRAHEEKPQGERTVCFKVEARLKWCRPWRQASEGQPAEGKEDDEDEDSEGVPRSGWVQKSGAAQESGAVQESGAAQEFCPGMKT